MLREREPEKEKEHHILAGKMSPENGRREAGRSLYAK